MLLGDEREMESGLIFNQLICEFEPRHPCQLAAVKEIATFHQKAWRQLPSTNRPNVRPYTRIDFGLGAAYKASVSRAFGGVASSLHLLKGVLLMIRGFVVLSIIALIVIGLFAYPVLFNPSASASPQELTVISRTRGVEVLTANFLDNQIRIRLQNNHKETITAFAIKFGTTVVKEDFAYSEVHFGIEPGETLEESYPYSRSSLGAELPTLHLLTVLLKDGRYDGSSKVAQEIKDVRLGNKIQIHRMLKILDKEGFPRKDIKALKGDITAALDAGEDEALVIRKQLFPASGMDDNLSEALKEGLHWGREKVLRRFQTLEQLPTERQEEGLIELKDRAHKLFAKL